MITAEEMENFIYRLEEAVRLMMQASDQMLAAARQNATASEAMSRAANNMPHTIWTRPG